MHPLLATFIRLTVMITIGLVALWVILAIFHWVLVAAVIAAVAIGGIFLYNLIRRRSNPPAIPL